MAGKKERRNKGSGHFVCIDPPIGEEGSDVESAERGLRAVE